MDMWDDRGAMHFFVQQSGGSIIKDLVVHLWQKSLWGDETEAHACGSCSFMVSSAPMC